MKHGANLFDDSSAENGRDPLRQCKSGRHVAKLFNKATGERVWIVCKKTVGNVNRQESRDSEIRD